MPKLPIRLSEVAPSGVGRTPSISLGAAAAPSVALAQGAGRISSQFFSFAAQQKRLDQLEETLGSITAINREINDFEILSKNNPDIKNHFNRMRVALSGILESGIGEIEDREVQLSVRRSIEPSINNKLLNAQTFQFKKVHDQTNATLQRFVEGQKQKAVEGIGDDLTRATGSIDGAYNAAANVGSITRVQAENLKRAAREDILQGKAIPIIRDNPELYLEMAAQGLFPFKDEKTKARMEELAFRSIQRLSAERDRRATKQEAAERRRIKQVQDKTSGLFTKRFYEGNTEGMHSDVDEAFLDGRLSKEDHRHHLATLETDREAGGRGNAKIRNITELRILVNGPINSKDITDMRGPRGLNDTQAIELIKINDDAEADDISKNPFYREGARDLTRAFGALEDAYIMKDEATEKALSAFREYNDLARSGKFTPDQLPGIARDITEKHGLSPKRFATEQDLVKAFRAGLLEPKEFKRQRRTFQREERQRDKLLEPKPQGPTALEILKGLFSGILGQDTP